MGNGLNIFRLPGGAVLFLLAAGFVIWSSSLVVLYAMQAIGCAVGWHQVVLGPITLHRILLLVLWAGHIAAIVLLAAWVRGQMAEREAETDTLSEFLLPAVWGSTLFALLATAWTGAPLLGTSTCT